MTLTGSIHLPACGQRCGHTGTPVVRNKVTLQHNQLLTLLWWSLVMMSQNFLNSVESHTPSSLLPFVPMGERNIRVSPLPHQVFTTHSLLVVLLQKTVNNISESTKYLTIASRLSPSAYPAVNTVHISFTFAKAFHFELFMNDLWLRSQGFTIYNLWLLW